LAAGDFRGENAAASLKRPIIFEILRVNDSASSVAFVPRPH
jgi:hypothetical protein